MSTPPGPKQATTARLHLPSRRKATPTFINIDLARIQALPGVQTYRMLKNGKDVLLNEAVHILSDEVVVLKTGARLAARVKPGSLLMPD